VLDHRYDRRIEFDARYELAVFFVGALHQRGVEWPRDVERHDTPRAPFLRLGSEFFNKRCIAGDHRLIRCIQIGRLHTAVICGQFITQCLEIGKLHADDGSHAAPSDLLMSAPRFATILMPSCMFSTPACTSAGSSPRLCPRTMSPLMPVAASTAMLWANNAGCVYSVWFRRVSSSNMIDFRSKSTFMKISSRTVRPSEDVS